MPFRHGNILPPKGWLATKPYTPLGNRGDRKAVGEHPQRLFRFNQTVVVARRVRAWPIRRRGMDEAAKLIDRNGDFW